LGTKKHQLNGVELTFTAIGIELFTFGKSNWELRR